MTSELDLLRAVEAENITWNRQSWRYWSSERDYTLVTKPMRELEKRALVERHLAAGYRYVTKGYVALTSGGKARLRELEAEQ